VEATLVEDETGGGGSRTSLPGAGKMAGDAPLDGSPSVVKKKGMKKRWR
jgi:hypothetical protein